MFTPRQSGRATLAGALVLGLLGASASVASAADRQIASTGTDGGDCVASACATLDYAQQQVQAGDTVRLAAGVYPVGGATFDVDDVTYERDGTGEAKITLPGDSYGIQVGGHDVTFRHLTVSSSDDTIQGDTWAFTYTGSGLALDHMLVGHTNQGVVALGGQGITVASSTFADISGTAVGVDGGHITATDNDFSSSSGVFVTDPATVTATGNVFRGTRSGGGTGIYVESGSAGGTVRGNRFSPNLEFGINNGQAIDAADNWWGCNEGLVTDGVDNPDCVANYDLPAENAEPHLVLDVSADPNPFPITGSSTITTSLTSSDPESTFVGGPIGTQVALSASEGSLDGTQLTLVSGVAQTLLRHTVPGFPLVTATLDNASATVSVEATVPLAAQAITFTSDAPTDAVVGGTYAPVATGGASGNPVTFSVDVTSTAGACTISGPTVSFTGAGTCTVNADQAGDASYTAADQKQQTIAVAPAPVTSASPVAPVLPAPTVPPAAVPPLELATVRSPVRCLIYGAATPKKRIALRTSATATVSWTVKKVRGSRVLSACGPALDVRAHTTTSARAQGSGAAKTDATGAADVALSTLLPTKLRKAMKPGLYRVTFTAQNDAGSSPKQAILIRVLKRR